MLQSTPKFEYVSSELNRLHPHEAEHIGGIFNNSDIHKRTAGTITERDDFFHRACRPKAFCTVTFLV